MTEALKDATMAVVLAPTSTSCSLATMRKSNSSLIPASDPTIAAKQDSFTTTRTTTKPALEGFPSTLAPR